MIVAAGGLGIVHNDPRYRRLYAVVFGLGGGLVGDEIGLLLTFGNYDSVLTLYFFVIVVSAGGAGDTAGKVQEGARVRRAVF